MEKLLKSFSFISVIIIFSFFLFSCNKNDNVTKNNSIKLVENSQTVETNTLVFGEEREKTGLVTNNIKDQAIFSEIEKGDIKGQLFPIISKTVIPEDMVIGSLLNFNIKTLTSGSFPYAVITFFTDLGKGVINNNVLHPLWNEDIEKLYSSSKTKQFDSIRIGAISDKNGILSANVRLFTRTGRVDGEVTADKFEGKLLLSNISIDFDSLDEIYLNENIEYNPLGYSNLLLNY